MQRRYRNRRARNLKRFVKLSWVPATALSIGLLLVWKSNTVKEYYATMKKLEGQRTDLIAENSGLRATLADLKSMRKIGQVVWERFGLTQNVLQRIRFNDPVAVEPAPDKTGFVFNDGVPDWLENAIEGSGKATAKPNPAPRKRTK